MVSASFVQYEVRWQNEHGAYSTGERVKSRQGTSLFCLRSMRLWDSREACFAHTVSAFSSPLVALFLHVEEFHQRLDTFERSSKHANQQLCL